VEVASRPLVTGNHRVNVLERCAGLHDAAHRAPVYVFHDHAGHVAGQSADAGRFRLQQAQSG
jgi:hypothetical protein